jgi:S1-C subfamily serine protease
VDFRRAIAQHAAGDEVELRFWRQGTEQSVRLTLASAPELTTPPAPATQPAGAIPPPR